MRRPIIGWAVRNAAGLTTVVMGPEEPPTPPGGEVVRILSVKEVPCELESAAASKDVC
jgi:hypothetical protein